MTHPDLELCRWTFETACADAEEAAADKEYAALEAEDGEKPQPQQPSDAWVSLVPGLQLCGEAPVAKAKDNERGLSALSFPASLRG